MGSTVLMYAANQGYHEIVNFLIDHGANVNHKNNDGLTPLSAAKANNHIKIIELLEATGAK